jgi:hypothetical protein
MSWMDQIGGLLQQYVGANAQQAPPDVHDDFSQVAQAAPPEELGQGIAAAFGSDQTPPFGQMVSHLFSQSNGNQQAGLLNTLIGAAGPGLVSQVLSNGGLSNLAGLLQGGGGVTPEQAQQVSPQVVGEIAAQAQNQDPSILNTVGGFFAQHPDLVRSLGGPALSTALSFLAQRNG